MTVVDDQLRLVHDARDGDVIGFALYQPHAWEPEAGDALIWDGPRFTVPALGMADGSIGELVTAL